MDITYYYFIIGLLLVLSCFDLIVGVSNDAVNFLNSAVGSKVAKRATIMCVASVGIIVGSLFSSGMMEIAKSGVFMPAEFTFHDIMLIFLAVMLTDVILLDVFNTFGLPTSTTVSIVFELLGGAVAVALFNIWTDAPGASMVLGDYINSTKALGIVSGILSSVVVALVCGVTVMWISRLIFSFSYEKPYKYVGALWSGIALTTITYFAVFKGLKGSVIVSKEMLEHVNANIMLYVGGSFAFWTVLMGVLQHICRINILKIAVLGGTLALAMSFAGNDLVNFIGVFMAALCSMDILQAAGGDVTMHMGALKDPATTQWYYLLGAGIIMVLALIFSKKARTVTETEVNLARQSSGVERFGSVPPARLAVRYALNMGKVVEKLLPARLAAFIEKRFQPLPEGLPNGASFDLIRASVNLTVASLLISQATALQLPLSTTYVTFMVAMGSSLADRAWGRDSAVYRITGVLTVIAGWFFTAFAAFTMCFIVAMCVVCGGIYGVIAMCALVVFLLIKSAVLHKKRSAQAQLAMRPSTANTDISARSGEIMELMHRMTDIYDMNLEALSVEDRKMLKKLRKETRAVNRSMREKMALEVMPSVRELPAESADHGKYYVQMVEFATAAFESLSDITSACFTYIDNNHEGPEPERMKDLRALSVRLSGLCDGLRSMHESNDFSGLANCLAGLDTLDEEVADIVKHRIILGSEDDLSDMRKTLLYLNLLNETRTMIRMVLLLGKVQRKLIASA